LLSKQLVLKNRGGLHARPAASFVQLANRFQSKITVALDERETNAKSIIGLMTLGAGQGKEITVIVDGVDEQVAMEEITAFLQNAD